MECDRSRELLLDTAVDGNVNFTALSVLDRVAEASGRAKVTGETRALPHVPVAGSRDWLPSMVEAGRQEVRRRACTCDVFRGVHDDTTLRHLPPSG